MQLEDFFDYKNQLMEDLLTSETIVKLINEDVDLDHSKSLVYNQVFPYRYVPDTIEDGLTFLCCDVEMQKALGKTFLCPTLYVWVLVHKSQLRLKQGGVRTDKIVSEIAKRINGSMMYGMGSLDLCSVKLFAPLTDFQGKVMMFQTTEWNRPAQIKNVPSNRKR